MYNHIAPYYDLIHSRLTADIGLLLTLAARAEGPVLELGCGSGRLLLPLARAGHTVTGVDNSPAMLALARKKLAAEPAAVAGLVRLVEDDMVNLQLEGQFGLAVIPYNTLMHLDPRQMARALRRLRPRLSEGGRLFIDLPNPLAVARTPDDRALTLEQVLAVPETDESLVLQASSWVEQERQLLHITWLYDRVPAGGGPLQRTVVEADYHYLYPHEIEIMLETAGFRLRAFYGNYNETPFDEDAERLLVLAE